MPPPYAFPECNSLASVGNRTLAWVPPRCDPPKSSSMFLPLKTRTKLSPCSYTGSNCIQHPPRLGACSARGRETEAGFLLRLAHSFTTMQILSLHGTFTSQWASASSSLSDTYSRRSPAEHGPWLLNNQISAAFQ